MTGAGKPNQGAGALDGVVVADFSRILAGPYMTMLLADLGATVIKVESPAGDDTRQWGPPWDDGISTYYKSINRNKKSVVLDLRREDIAPLQLEPRLLQHWPVRPCLLASPQRRKGKCQCYDQSEITPEGHIA